MSTTDAIATGHRIKGALSLLGCAIEVERGDAGVALVFRHPRLQRQIVIQVTDSEQGPVIGVHILLSVWADVRDQDGEPQRLLGLNDRLMSAAVALVPLMDTPVVALVRRLPAAGLPAEDVADLIDAMAWEYATVSRQGGAGPEDAAQSDA